jgi:hypothetical protein
MALRRLPVMIGAAAPVACKEAASAHARVGPAATRFASLSRILLSVCTVLTLIFAHLPGCAALHRRAADARRCAQRLRSGTGPPPGFALLVGGVQPLLRLRAAGRVAAAEVRLRIPLGTSVNRRTGTR